jgi:hypothetical protein
MHFLFHRAEYHFFLGPFRETEVEICLKEAIHHVCSQSYKIIN